MNRIARQEIYTGRHLSLSETLRLIDRVSKDELVALAKDLVTPGRMSAVALGPLDAAFFSEFDWSGLE